MPRKRRIIIPQCPHHVTQRGNNKQVVFETLKDYQKYSYWIKEYSLRYQVDIYAYCLMPNHVHFILSPMTIEGLSRLFNAVNMLYSQYKNEKEGRVGHLWHGRYYSCVLSDDHLLRAIRYVENNPVRAQLARKAWDYVWSSAREHMGMRHDSIISLRNIWRLIEVDNWKAYLVDKDDEILEQIRIRTKRGLAVGSKIFLKQLEDRFDINFYKLRKSSRSKYNT